MNNQEAKLVDLLTNLSSNVNPYLVAANTLEAAVHSPLSPIWVRNLKIALVVLEEIMLFQSSLLFYQRLRISNHPKLKRNTCLVVVNISYIAAFTYFVYSIMSIYALLVQIAAERGHRMNEAFMLLIFALRFFTVLVGSWAFLWVCACQCALILWHSNLASKMNRDWLKSLIRGGYSFLVVLFAIGPLPAIAWQYIKVYSTLHELESIADQIVARLRFHAESYDPLNFNQLTLLTSLLPARQLLPLRDQLEKDVRLGQKLYLADLSFLSLVYIPLLVISLKYLYKQSKFYAEMDAAVGSVPPLESDITVRIRRQRQRLVFHAICVYVATTIHLPVVIYSVHLSETPGFTQLNTWRQLTFLGLTVPLSITGNTILVVLNLHSYLILRDRANPSMGNVSCSLATTSASNRFTRAANYALGFIRHTEEATELEDLEEFENRRAVRSSKADLI